MANMVASAADGGSSECTIARQVGLWVAGAMANECALRRV